MATGRGARVAPPSGGPTAACSAARTTARSSPCGGLESRTREKAAEKRFAGAVPGTRTKYAGGGLPNSSSQAEGRPRCRRRFTGGSCRRIVLCRRTLAARFASPAPAPWTTASVRLRARRAGPRSMTHRGRSRRRRIRPTCLYAGAIEGPDTKRVVMKRRQRLRARSSATRWHASVNVRASVWGRPRRRRARRCGVVPHGGRHAIWKQSRRDRGPTPPRRAGSSGFERTSLPEPVRDGPPRSRRAHLDIWPRQNAAGPNEPPRNHDGCVAYRAIAPRRGSSRRRGRPSLGMAWPIS